MHRMGRTVSLDGKSHPCYPFSENYHRNVSFSTISQKIFQFNVEKNLPEFYGLLLNELSFLDMTSKFLFFVILELTFIFLQVMKLESSLQKLGMSKNSRMSCEATVISQIIFPRTCISQMRWFLRRKIIVKIYFETCILVFLNKSMHLTFLKSLNKINLKKRISDRTFQQAKTLKISLPTPQNFLSRARFQKAKKLK